MNEVSNSSHRAISSAPPGLFKKLDRALVTVIALCEAEIRECTAKIAETGLVVASRKYGVVTSPRARTGAWRCSCFSGLSPRQA